MALTNTAEGGTDAVVLTTANTGGASGNAFDEVTQAADAIAEFDTAISRETTSMMFATRTTVGSAKVGWNVSITGTTYGRVYIYMGATPVTNPVRFIHARDLSNLGSFSIQWTSANKIAILDGNSALQATSATTMTSRLDSWVRIEWETIISGANGQVTARMYDADSNSEFEILQTPATINTRGDIGIYRFGAGAVTDNANMPTSTDFLWLDNLVADATDWPGSFDPGVDALGPVYLSFPHWDQPSLGL